MKRQAYDWNGNPIKKKNRNEERTWEKKFIERMQADTRAHKIRDDGIRNPYDGFVVSHCGRYMPYEAKYEENKVTHSNKTWRKKQPHQIEALFDDFNENRAWPFKLVFWNPKGILSEPRFCILSIYEMQRERVKLPDLPTIKVYEDLFRVLGRAYSRRW